MNLFILLLICALGLFLIKLSLLIAKSFDLIFNKLGIDIDFWGSDKDV